MSLLEHTSRRARWHARQRVCLARLREAVGRGGVLGRIALGVAAAISRQGLAVVMMLLAAAAFPPKEFGEYAVAWAITTMVFTLVHTGIHEYLLRAEDPEVADTCFWLNLAVGLAGSLLILGVAAMLDAASDRAMTAQLLVVLAPMSLVTGAVAWAGAQVLRQGRTNTYNFILAATETLAFAVGVVLLQLGVGLLALAVWRIVGSLAAATALHLAAGSLPRLSFRPSLARAAIRGALPLYGSRSVQLLTGYGSDLLLAQLVSAASAGIYRVGSRVANGMGDVICMPLVTIAWARIAGDRRAGADAKAAALNLGHYLALIAWPVLATLVVCADVAVAALLGPEWSGASAVIVLAALSKMLLALDVVLEPVLVCSGRARQQFWLRLAHSLLLIALLAVACRFGAAWAAAAHLAAAICFVAVAVPLLMRALQMRLAEFVASLWGGAVAMLLCMAAAFASKMLASLQGAAPLPQAILAATGAGLAWLLMLGAMMLVNRRESASPALMRRGQQA